MRVKITGVCLIIASVALNHWLNLDVLHGTVVDAFGALAYFFGVWGAGKDLVEEMRKS